MRLLPFFLGSFGLVVACGTDVTRECRVGADCASGVCSEDGVCASGAAASSDPGAPPPASSAPNEAAKADAALPGCVPNFDGMIERKEVPLQAGLKATYRVAADVDVSTAGTTNSGARTWDFSIATTKDENVLVETVALTGKWYAGKFGGATYATKLRASSSLEGVFETGAGSIALRGVASPDDGLYRTELTNDPPVAVLAFPVTLGKTWTEETTVTGLAQGVFSTYSEKYESNVDAKGTLKTPLGTFEVLRVRVLLTRTIGWVPTRIRTFAFVSECFGTVATVTSRDNESDVDFTRAAELRRIAP